MNILVTDGENRSALAVTRSLGRKGYSVFVVGSDSGNISACSKFCRRAYIAPNPLSNCHSYGLTIAQIADKERIDMIFPMTEQSIYCLNEARGELGDRVILACAPPDKMEAVSNKYRLFQMAEKLGVATPETVYITDAEDFLAKRTLVTGFPVVVKPAFSKIKDGDRIIPTRVMFAMTSDELDRLYETKPELRFPSMIQELIRGEGTGLFTLFDHNRHLALFSHRRLLEKPPSGGVSVLSESIPLDDEMVAAAEKLLSRFQWSGIAMVEFKRDNRDGKAKLMEINGRFWGSLQLAISSGVDFPVLCLNYYLDKKPKYLLANYAIEHKLRWCLGILDYFIIRLKKSDSIYNFSLDIPNGWQVVSSILEKKHEKIQSDVYDSEDWKPFLQELKTYIRKSVGL